MDGDDGANEAMERAKEKNKEIVSRLMEEFKEQWEPAMDKLDKAAKAFEGLDLDDLFAIQSGFPSVSELCPEIIMETYTIQKGLKTTFRQALTKAQYVQAHHCRKHPGVS